MAVISQLFYAVYVIQDYAHKINSYGYGYYKISYCFSPSK